MSKYIIDIPKTVGMGILGSVHYTYFDGIQCQTIVLKSDEIEELNSDYINEHYGDLQDDAYERGHGVGYQKGFEDGKAVSNKGCEGCKYEGRELNKLPCMVCSNSRKNCWTAKQTDNCIEIGDEVKWEGVNFTVLRVFTPKGCYEQCDGFDCDGNGYTNILTKDVTKTGRHFDIASILKEMQS